MPLCIEWASRMADKKKRITLKAALKARGWTQCELARRTHGKLTQASISRVLSGKRRDWRSSTLQSIAEALGMGLDELSF